MNGGSHVQKAFTVNTMNQTEMGFVPGAARK